MNFFLSAAIATDMEHDSISCHGCPFTAKWQTKCKTHLLCLLEDNCLCNSFVLETILSIPHVGTTAFQMYLLRENAVELIQ